MNQEILKQNFENHGFKTAFFSTAKEAADYLSARIRETSVSIGGSITVKEMGLAERLRENNEVIWHWDIPGRETLLQARDAKVYLASANGVSETERETVFRRPSMDRKKYILLWGAIR